MARPKHRKMSRRTQDVNSPKSGSYYDTLRAITKDPVLIDAVNAAEQARQDEMEPQKA